MYERLLNKQIVPTFEELAVYCGEGGWIHYRVLNEEHFYDIMQLLALKCS